LVFVPPWRSSTSQCDQLFLRRARVRGKNQFVECRLLDQLSTLRGMRSFDSCAHVAYIFEAHTFGQSSVLQIMRCSTHVLMWLTCLQVRIFAGHALLNSCAHVAYMSASAHFLQSMCCSDSCAHVAVALTHVLMWLTCLQAHIFCRACVAQLMCSYGLHVLSAHLRPILRFAGHALLNTCVRVAYMSASAHFLQSMRCSTHVLVWLTCPQVHIFCGCNVSKHLCVRAHTHTYTHTHLFSIACIRTGHQLDPTVPVQPGQAGCCSSRPAPTPASHASGVCM